MVNLDIRLQGKKQIMLCGALGFATVPSAYTQIIALMDQLTTVCIDLYEVHEVDSAALVLLLELVQIAAQREKKLSIVQVPEELMTLVKMNGLDALLPLSARKL